MVAQQPSLLFFFAVHNFLDGVLSTPEICIMAQNRSAFSELFIVVIFLGIFAAIAVPRLNFGIISKQKVDTIATKIVTDLHRTRALAISDAANNSDGYELKMVGSVPYTAYEMENLDTHETVDSHTTNGVTISCSGGHKFKFGTLGQLKSGSATELVVSAEGRSFTITINPATGMVKCVQD
jgi:Tfp pilus assembly protein FimT